MDCGDANPGNVRSGAVPHIIRVALTRAKVRALRDAVNIGTIPLEEFGELPLAPSGPLSKPPGATETDPPETSRAVRPMTEAQRKHLFTLIEKQGKTGDEAEAYLCQQMGVKRLAEATVSGASALIQSLTGKTPGKPAAKQGGGNRP